LDYYNTDLKNNSRIRHYNFNTPQELIHSNASHKFYNYFFNYSPALDPFSEKYYLKNPKLEYKENYRKPSPVADVKLSFSHDNYLKYLNTNILYLNNYLYIIMFDFLDLI